jgi:hypothetical protein
MKNQKTPKDILMKIIMGECNIENIDLDDEEMSEEEIVQNIILTELVREIFTFTIKFFENRFIKELKQYNSEEKKAYDEFSCRRNLELFRFHIEEILPLQFEMGLIRDSKDIYHTRIKYFRNIHNRLCIEFNGQIKNPYIKKGDVV